jgi:hypothetical protein
MERQQSARTGIDGTVPGLVPNGRHGGWGMAIPGLDGPPMEAVMMRSMGNMGHPRDRDDDGASPPARTKE